MTTKRRQIITIETMKRTVVHRVNCATEDPVVGSPIHRPDGVDETRSEENSATETTATQSSAPREKGR